MSAVSFATSCINLGIELHNQLWNKDKGLSDKDSVVSGSEIFELANTFD